MFSCVHLFVVLWAAACQAPLSVGFPRQEYWSGLPFSSLDLSNPGTENQSPALAVGVYVKSLQSCPTVCDPMTLCDPTRLLCPWDSPGKNTGVDCRALVLGTFPTQASNLRLLCLLRWPTLSLPLAPPREPLHWQRSKSVLE